MAGKVAVGSTQIPKIAVGATNLKRISIGTVEVWSGVEQLVEEWNLIDTNLWTSAVDPGGSGQYLTASSGLLQAPGVSSWNVRNRAFVVSKKQYPTPYGKWAVRMGGSYSTGLSTFIVLSMDSIASEGVTFQMTYNSCSLFYRGNSSQSATTLGSWNFGYNTNAWVIVERTEDSVYRVSFDGGSTWPISYSDPDRIAEQPQLGYIGCAIESDQNFFGTKGYGGPIDRFKYTNDSSENITA
ncbi:hypothetical protein SEA_SOOS_60 [Gordonia phage Soos]|nr:hypothetical protein SEA_SOOS_60 [Gordonia phage Soos]